MSTFETPTWVKREGCRLFLDRVGLGSLVDAVPDDKMDEFADAVAAVAADLHDESDDGR